MGFAKERRSDAGLRIAETDGLVEKQKRGGKRDESLNVVQKLF